MNVIYTEAAQKELIIFQEKQKQLLEEMVADKKFIYGDETLEITASDIKEAADRIRPIRPASRASFFSYRLAAQLYLFVGLLMMMGAFFYDHLVKLFSEDRTKAMIFVAGAFTFGMGLIALNFYLVRQQRYEEIMKKSLD